jgi:hypothetical protein
LLVWLVRRLPLQGQRSVEALEFLHFATTSPWPADEPTLLALADAAFGSVLRPFSYVPSTEQARHYCVGFGLLFRAAFPPSPQNYGVRCK